MKKTSTTPAENSDSQTHTSIHARTRLSGVNQETRTYFTDKTAASRGSDGRYIKKQTPLGLLKILADKSSIQKATTHAHLEKKASQTLTEGISVSMGSVSAKFGKSQAFLIDSAQGTPAYERGAGAEFVAAEVTVGKGSAKIAARADAGMEGSMHALGLQASAEAGGRMAYQVDPMDTCFGTFKLAPAVLYGIALGANIGIGRNKKGRLFAKMGTKAAFGVGVDLGFEYEAPQEIEQWCQKNFSVFTSQMGDKLSSYDKEISKVFLVSMAAAFPHSMLLMPEINSKVIAQITQATQLVKQGAAEFSHAVEDFAVDFYKSLVKDAQKLAATSPVKSALLQDTQAALQRSQEKITSLKKVGNREIRSFLAKATQEEYSGDLLSVLSQEINTEMLAVQEESFPNYQVFIPEAALDLQVLTSSVGSPEPAEAVAAAAEVDHFSPEDFRDVMTIATGLSQLVLRPKEARAVCAAANVLTQGSQLFELVKCGAGALKIATSITGVCSAIDGAIKLFNPGPNETEILLNAVQGIVNILNDMRQEIRAEFAKVHEHLMLQDQKLFEILLHCAAQEKKLDALVNLMLDVNHSVKKALAELGTLNLNLAHTEQRLVQSMHQVAMNSKKEELIKLLRTSISKENEVDFHQLLVAITTLAISPENVSQFSVSADWIQQYSQPLQGVRALIPAMRNIEWWCIAAFSSLVKFYQAYQFANEQSDVESISKKNLLLLADVIQTGEALYDSTNELLSLDIQHCLKDYHTSTNTLKTLLETELEQAFQVTLEEELQRPQSPYQEKLFKSFSNKKVLESEIKDDYPGWFGGMMYYMTGGGKNHAPPAVRRHRESVMNSAINYEAQYRNSIAARTNQKLTNLINRIVEENSHNQIFSAQIKMHFFKAPTLVKPPKYVFASAKVRPAEKWLVPLPQKILEHLVSLIPNYAEWLVAERLSLTHIQYTYEIVGQDFLLSISVQVADNLLVLAKIKYRMPNEKLSPELDASFCPESERLISFLFGGYTYRLQERSGKWFYCNGRNSNTYKKLMDPVVDTKYQGFLDKPRILTDSAHILEKNDSKPNFSRILLKFRNMSVEQVKAAIQTLLGNNTEDSNPILQVLKKLEVQIQHLRWWYSYALHDFCVDTSIQTFLATLFDQARVLSLLSNSAEDPKILTHLNTEADAEFMSDYTHSLIQMLQEQQVTANHDLLEVLDQLQMFYTQYRSKSAEVELSTADEMVNDLVSIIIDESPELRTRMTNRYIERLNLKTPEERKKAQVCFNRLAQQKDFQLKLEFSGEQLRLTDAEPAASQKSPQDDKKKRPHLVSMIQNQHHMIHSAALLRELIPSKMQKKYALKRIQDKLLDYPDHLMDMRNQTSINTHITYSRDHENCPILFESEGIWKVLRIRPRQDFYIITLENYKAISADELPSISESFKSAISVALQANMPNLIWLENLHLTNNFPATQALRFVLTDIPNVIARMNLSGASCSSIFSNSSDARPRADQTARTEASSRVATAQTTTPQNLLG